MRESVATRVARLLAGAPSPSVPWGAEPEPPAWVDEIRQAGAKRPALSRLVNHAEVLARSAEASLGPRALPESFAPAMAWLRLAGSVSESSRVDPVKASRQIHILTNEMGLGEPASSKIALACVNLRADQGSDEGFAWLASRVDWAEVDQRESVALAWSVSRAARDKGRAGLVKDLVGAGMRWGQEPWRAFVHGCLPSAAFFILGRGGLSAEKVAEARLALAASDFQPTVQDVFAAWAVCDPDMADVLIERGVDLSAIVDLKAELGAAWSVSAGMQTALVQHSSALRARALATRARTMERAMPAWERSVLRAVGPLELASLGHSGARL